jgi:3-dehydroquinate dehydratase
MQAVIQSLESFVLAMAVTAFAHFGVALKDAPCAKAAPAVHRIAYVRPRTVRPAPAPLAKDVRRA